MDSLFAAIDTTFNATVGLNAVNGPWLDAVPAQDAIPFCRVVGPEFLLERFFGGQYIAESEIQFSIFATGLQVATGYQDALEAAFDNQTLTLSSGSCFRFQLVRKAVMRDHSDKNNEELYHARSHFSVRYTPALT